VVADPAVSRRHAEISVRGDRCSIRNLASLNGTHVNVGGAVEAFVR
jgi:pSer/pThr/pTyr-binding forkhead associated (FHA) protein